MHHRRKKHTNFISKYVDNKTAIPPHQVQVYQEYKLQ